MLLPLCVVTALLVSCNETPYFDEQQLREDSIFVRHGDQVDIEKRYKEYENGLQKRIVVLELDQIGMRYDTVNVSECVYDADGRLVEMSVMEEVSGERYVEWRKCEHDEKGNLLRVRTTEDGQLLTDESRTWGDVAGKPVVLEMCSKEWNYNDSTYEYTHVKSEFDDRGNETVRTVMTSEDSIEWRISCRLTWQYNEDSLRISGTFDQYRNGEWETVASQESEFSERKETKVVSKMGGVELAKREMMYDKAGNITSEVVSEVDDETGEWKPRERTEYKYKIEGEVWIKDEIHYNYDSPTSYILDNESITYYTQKEGLKTDESGNE